MNIKYKADDNVFFGSTVGCVSSHLQTCRRKYLFLETLVWSHSMVVSTISITMTIAESVAIITETTVSTVSKTMTISTISKTAVNVSDRWNRVSIVAITYWWRRISWSVGYLRDRCGVRHFCDGRCNVLSDRWSYRDLKTERKRELHLVCYFVSHSHI